MCTRTVLPSTRTVTLVITSTCTSNSTGNRASVHTCVYELYVYLLCDNSNRETTTGTIIITDNNVTNIRNNGNGTSEGIITEAVVIKIRKINSISTDLRSLTL